MSRTPPLICIRRLCLCLGLFCIGNPLWAAPIIEITGNEKTRTSYIEKLTRICLPTLKATKYVQKDLANLEKGAHLQQCLINSGLFSRVVVRTYTDERIVLEITDKAHRLVLPTYQRSQVREDIFWGVLLFDANVAGRGHSTALLYTRQQERKRNSYSFFYNIPYTSASGKHGFTLIGYNRDTDFYSYENTRWKYKTREIFQFLWLRGSYYITPDFELLYGYAPSILGYSESVNRDNPAAIAADSYIEIQSLNLGILYDLTDRKYYYDKGFRFDSTYYQQVSRTDDKDISAAYLMDLYYGIPPRSDSRHIFSLRMLGGTRDRVDEVDNLRIGSEPGSRGIPDKGAWNGQYLTVGLDYQLPIVRGRYGYWTAGPFVDYGYQWGVFHHSVQDFGYHATGISSFVHLLNINFPAIGMFYSSNSHYQKDFLSFYIGFSI